MDVTLALAVCRFGRDGAALLLWGGGAYLAVLAPADLGRALAPGWAQVRRAALVMVALAVAALLPVQAASLGRGWPDAFDGGTLRALLGETTLGTAWMVQAAAAVMMLAGRALPARWREGATTGSAGLLLAALTLTGHAAMREGWPGAAQRGLYALHLLAGGFWLGALVPLLPTLRILARPDLRGDAAVALRRFSLFGHGAVAAVVATGIGNAAPILGSWPATWATPYRGLLAGKAVAVAVMAALAVLNRYVYVPRLSRDGDAAARRIRVATLAEIVCGFGAVALVALFGLLEPG